MYGQTIRCVLLATLLAACGAVGSAAPGERDSLSEAVSEPAVAVGADSVRPLIGGPVAFAAVRAALDSASRKIEVEMYEFQRRDLADRLLAAHARGAQVVVILDALAAGSAAIQRRLRAAGITAVDYPSDARAIDHVKLLLVDGTVGIVGGINWGLASDRHRDYAVEVRGPAVANLERAFQSDLAAAGRPAERPAAVADAAVHVLTTRPGREIEAAVLDGLAAATRRVTLEMFVLTAPAAIRALQAARQRGVAVRVLLDRQQDTTSARATLRQGGMAAEYYAGAGKLHAKTVVIDGTRVILGSANWTHSGFTSNHELDLEILSPAIAIVFETAMGKDWPAGAHASGLYRSEGAQAEGASARRPRPAVPRTGWRHEERSRSCVTTAAGPPDAGISAAGARRSGAPDAYLLAGTVH